MKKISSGSTYFYKRIFPVIWFMMAAIFVAIILLVPGAGRSMPFPALVAPVVVAVIGFVIMKKFVFDLMDEVWDAGDVLVVKLKDQEDRIPLAEIMNISYSGFSNPRRATLTLRHPGLFGREITFCPVAKANFSGKNPVIDDLIERVDRARGGH